MSSALKAHDRIHIFIRAAITPQFFKEKQIEKYAPVVSKITNGSKIIERHLIASLELVSKEKPKNFAVMIKQFYDEDALEEETIIEWADDGRSEYTLDAVEEETRAVLRGEAEPWLFGFRKRILIRKMRRSKNEYCVSSFCQVLLLNY